jgi:hypothetical protein
MRRTLPSSRQAFEQADLSTDDRFENLNCETRVRINGRLGRILVLPANLRTAHGFSGDAVFDEFAFQQDGAAIWDAASVPLVMTVVRRFKRPPLQHPQKWTVILNSADHVGNSPPRRRFRLPARTTQAFPEAFHSNRDW